MLKTVLIPIALLGLAGCKLDQAGTSEGSSGESANKATSAAVDSADTLAAHDPALGQSVSPDQADDKPRPVMQAQVVLDRLGFTPGVIDGREGLSTRNALAGFQDANDLPASGELDDATRSALAQWSNIPATRVVTIPADFAAGPFVKLPEDAAQQAKLPAMSYETLDEKLAERFHTTIDTLKALNPRPDAAPATPKPTEGAVQPYFRAGERIRVPNVGGDRIDAASVSDAKWRATLTSLGVGSNQPKAASIVVSKSRSTLRAYDDKGKLIGAFTATMGSQHDPLPLGTWKVKGTAYNPPFHYNPELFWDVSDDEAKRLLPPGPNGPVGVAWIDLNKEHYGIHGTPNPETIGRAQSHGCVRLTNWDVARLAQMVSPGTKVVFEA